MEGKKTPGIHLATQKILSEDVKLFLSEVLKQPKRKI